MNPQIQKYGQDAQERACAQKFLDWLSSKANHIYELRRAEQAFPELRGHLRWDFVARQKESPEWIALEVKRLPFLGLNKPWSDWKKLLEQVNQHIQSRLNSTIQIHFPPKLNLDQQKRKELIPVLADVIVKEAPALKSNAPLRDIGPQIWKRFLDWPRIKSEDIEEYDRFGEYRPAPIYITRESEQGDEVRLFGVGNGGDLGQAHQLALAAVFDVDKAVKANKQLELANEKGALGTFLLLDCDPGYQECDIRKYLCTLDPAHLSNIDHIYLVGGAEVVEVFSEEGKNKAKQTSP